MWHHFVAVDLCIALVKQIFVAENQRLQDVSWTSSWTVIPMVVKQQLRRSSC
jgi:hypothetical protein